MKAKDIKWCPQHGYPLPCHKCGMPLSQPQQREIYKAGIRETGKLLGQFTEGDIYGDERTGDYMLFQIPSKIFEAIKKGKLT